VVEKSTPHPVIQGWNPTTGIERERIAKNYHQCPGSTGGRTLNTSSKYIGFKSHHWHREIKMAKRLTPAWQCPGITVVEYSTSNPKMESMT
jgi:hypothetical protein